MLQYPPAMYEQIRNWYLRSVCNTEAYKARREKAARDKEHVAVIFDCYRKLQKGRDIRDYHALMRAWSALKGKKQVCVKTKEYKKSRRKVLASVRQAHWDALLCIFASEAVTRTPSAFDPELPVVTKSLVEKFTLDLTGWVYGEHWVDLVKEINQETACVYVPYAIAPESPFYGVVQRVLDRWKTITVSITQGLASPSWAGGLRHLSLPYTTDLSYADNSLQHELLHMVQSLVSFVRSRGDWENSDVFFRPQFGYPSRHIMTYDVRQGYHPDSAGYFALDKIQKRHARKLQKREGFCADYAHALDDSEFYPRLRTAINDFQRRLAAYPQSYEGYLKALRSYTGETEATKQFPTNISFSMWRRFAPKKWKKAVSVMVGETLP